MVDRPGRSSRLPLYHHVARMLLEQIASGEYPAGSQLPPESELCKVFSVSRHTVRDAIRKLRDEQLVVSRQGAGTIVLPPRSSTAFVLNTQTIDDLIVFATGLHTEILFNRLEVVPNAVTGRPDEEGREEWLVASGLVRTDATNQAICGSTHYIHRDFSAIARLLPRHTGPLFLLIEEMFAVRIEELDQEIAVGVIDAPLAAHLGTETGATAIDVKRTFKTADGTVAQITIHTHPAKNFRQRMKMRRPKD